MDHGVDAPFRTRRRGSLMDCEKETAQKCALIIWACQNSSPNDVTRLVVSRIEKSKMDQKALGV